MGPAVGAADERGYPGPVAVLALFTGAGAALYLAAWLLIPAEGEDESIAAAWIARRQDRSRQAPEPRTA
jgi:hypothetical protein